MITKGAEALIIAAIDGTTLSRCSRTPPTRDIPVIAYDRLIRDTENVDYYATFDNFLVGQQQAWSLLNGLGLTELDGTPDRRTLPPARSTSSCSPARSTTTTRSSSSNGAMDVLQPLIDDGTLVVKSGQTDIEQAAILRWDGEVAQSRMENILTSTYSDGSQVNAVLSPYDGLSRGIISALTDAGYSVGEGWPIISGQDAEVDSVKAINSGEQYATIFKDTRELAKVAADMAVADPERRGARGERHRGLRQRREGRSVVPARVRSSSSRTTSTESSSTAATGPKRRSTASHHRYTLAG